MTYTVKNSKILLNLKVLMEDYEGDKEKEKLDKLEEGWNALLNEREVGSTDKIAVVIHIYDFYCALQINKGDLYIENICKINKSEKNNESFNFQEREKKLNIQYIRAENVCIGAEQIKQAFMALAKNETQKAEIALVPFVVCEAARFKAIRVLLKDMKNASEDDVLYKIRYHKGLITSWDKICKNIDNYKKLIELDDINTRTFSTLTDYIDNMKARFPDDDF